MNKITSQPPHQSPRQRLVPVIIWALMFIMAAAIGLLIYWAVAAGDVLEVKNSPVPVRTIRPHAQANGVVILKTDFCKKVNATGRVRVSFVSTSREVFLPISEDKSPPRCETTELPIIIPKDIAPDTYVVKFRVTYQVNPLKSVIEDFDSQPFEVVKE